MNAVRLETGSIELELSNRVQTASNDSSTNKFSAPKLFVKMQVDLNLALGMLMCNPMFEEAEAEFQHLASFATRIGLRNALQACFDFVYFHFLSYYTFLAALLLKQSAAYLVCTAFFCV